METALYLIPVALGETEFSRVLPNFNASIVSKIKNFIVESKKSAIRSLKMICPQIDIDSLNFYDLNEHTDLSKIDDCLDPILKRKESIGLLSDAGCPAVADPGAAAVALAQKKHLKIIPLVGPSSIILSLMASGFNGQSFAFNGYLPVKPNERTSKLRQLENRVWNENQTQIFIEAPYRNLKILESIFSTCKKSTKLCVASGITTEQEFIKTYSIEEWKKLPVPQVNKIPTIFLLYK